MPKKLLKARAGRKTRVHTMAGKTPAISFGKLKVHNGIKRFCR